jgi:hypothetical protein
MKFEEALKAMREGKKVERNGGKFCYYMKNNVLYHENSDGDKESLNDGWCGFNIRAVLADDWVVVDPCAIEESKTDKIDQIDLKITFIGGGEIMIPNEQWDDYRYDGKFFTIIKDGADIAMYNAKEVFSLVFVRQGEG